MAESNAQGSWKDYLVEADSSDSVDVMNAKIACRQLNTVAAVNNNQCNREYGRGVNVRNTGYLGSSQPSCAPVKVSEVGNVGFGAAMPTGGACQDLTTLDSTMTGRRSGSAGACFAALTPALSHQGTISDNQWESMFQIDSVGINSASNSPQVLSKDGNPVPQDLNALAYDYNQQQVGSNNAPSLPSGFADVPSYYNGAQMAMSGSCTDVLSSRNVGACNSVNDNKCQFIN